MSDAPYLSSDYIEAEADTVALLANRPPSAEPTFTPLAEIVLKLVSARRLSIRFDKDLGRTRDGKKVLGAFVFEGPAIFIDRDLDQSGPRFKFTLAHELGHWTLHRTLRLKSAELDKPLRILRDSSQHLYFGRAGMRTQRDRIEWQANRFAAAFLVPRAALLIAMVQKQKELQVTRNVGTIYLDRQWQNRRNFNLILRHLQDTFQVSRTMLIIRLQQLKLLIHESEVLQISGLRHITAFLRSEDSGSYEARRSPEKVLAMAKQ